MTKSDVIKVRVTENQREELEQAALNKEKKLSEFIRDRLFNENTIGSLSDPIVQLTKLKKKYIEDKSKEQNIMKGHAISMKINTLDEIIIDLSSLNS